MQKNFYNGIDELTGDLLNLPPKRAKELLSILEDINKKYKNPIVNKMCNTLNIHTIYTTGLNVLKYYDE